MKITMIGKYAYCKDPYTRVRILCVDRPGYPDDPVCSMDLVDGHIRRHTADGSGEEGYSLVPLQEKLPDLWVNIYPDGKTYCYHDEALANRNRGSWAGRTVKYIPAPDQTS